MLYDELDLPLGTIRIRERGSANGHNGVKSISGALGTEEWLRIRIGVGQDRRWRMAERSRRAARIICCRRCASRSLRCWMKCSTGYAAAVEAMLTKGVSAAMNEFNRKRVSNG